MKLAILMTNTDESAFAQAHPRDGAKFTALVQRARPGWTTVVFAVKDGVFPESLDGFDGLVITGSPASVNSGEPWVARLMELIRDAARAGVPMFGACFGHQAIAVALGGRVEANPGGLVHGLVPVRLTSRPQWAADLPETLHLFASHEEQVTRLPVGAKGIAESAGCPVAGFVVGERVMTTQHHPEMTEAFFAALTEAFAEDLGTETVARARAPTTRKPDMDAFAEAVARFFETGRRVDHSSAARRSSTVT